MHATLQYFQLQEAENKLEEETNELHSRMEKREKEIEQKVKEIDDLREAIKNLDQEKFQELDKVCFGTIVIIKLQATEFCSFFFESIRSCRFASVTFCVQSLSIKVYRW